MGRWDAIAVCYAARVRKALGYGWSVASVAAPEAGRRAFESLDRETRIDR
jgi:hypothetical protein